MNVSDTKVRKIMKEAKERARLSTPKYSLLTWCVRQVLHAQGWRPYY